MSRILVTGALGQIGSWLVPALRSGYGPDAVLATDLRTPGERPDSSVRASKPRSAREEGPFRRVDATDPAALAEAVRDHRADTVYHLAAILSAVGEENPTRTWAVNMGSLEAVLEIARRQGCALFVPSSIAVFGPDSPGDPAPQNGPMRPTSIYGVTKLAGELLCDYYHLRYGLDVRGLRYPGLVSYGAPPGGGTTDWSVEMFDYAVRGRPYPSFLHPDTRLDIMYMPDAVRAAMELMEADGTLLRHRNSYNVTAMQLSPGLLAKEIRKHIRGFTVSHDPDPVRQAIADSWPDRLDDRAARADWGWRHEFDLGSMTRDMVDHNRRERAVDEDASRAGDEPRPDRSPSQIASRSDRARKEPAAPAAAGV